MSALTPDMRFAVRGASQLAPHEHDLVIELVLSHLSSQMQGMPQNLVINSPSRLSPFLGFLESDDTMVGN